MRQSVELVRAERSVGGGLRSGWGRAAAGAVVAATAAAAVAELAALLLQAGRPVPGTTTVDALRHGWALFYLFHHVGIEVVSPKFHLPGGAEVVAGAPSGYDVDLTLGLAAMTGTALVLWLLYRAGRATAEAAGGEALERGLHGLKVALPYALLCHVPSWWMRFRLELPGASSMSIHPSHLASLFWPLALAALMGFVGGVRSAGEGIWASDWWETDRWNRRWRGAVAGGWRMAWLAVALTVPALAGLAMTRASDTMSYFRGIGSNGVLGGIALGVLTAFMLPNMAAWLLAPAMGGCLEVGGASSHPFCFLSYGVYPGHPLGGAPTNPAGFPNLGSAPPIFVLFALVPAVAVVLGGMRAARRGAARSPGDAVLLGALAGGVFGVLMLFLFVLATVTAVFNGPIYYVATGSFRYGPNPLPSFWLALEWGTLGGALGGWLAYRTRNTAHGFAGP